MDSLNLQRQGLLLELVRNITQNNTPGYSDEYIYKNILKYKELLQDFNVSYELKQVFPFEKENELNKLHRIFYGEDFNFSDPSENGLGKGDNIFEEFKKVFTKIEELATTKDQLSDKILKSLKEILGTVVYSNSKSNDQIMSYLNLIDMTLAQYKPSSGSDSKSANIGKTAFLTSVKSFSENKVKLNAKIAKKEKDEKDAEIEAKNEFTKNLEKKQSIQTEKNK